MYRSVSPRILRPKCLWKLFTPEVPLEVLYSRPRCLWKLFIYAQVPSENFIFARSASGSSLYTPEVPLEALSLHSKSLWKLFIYSRGASGSSLLHPSSLWKLFIYTGSFWKLFTPEVPPEALYLSRSRSHGYSMEGSAGGGQLLRLKF